MVRSINGIFICVDCRKIPQILDLAKSKQVVRNFRTQQKERIEYNKTTKIFMMKQWKINNTKN